MTHSNHIVHKVFVEVNTANEETAYSFKDNISTFLKENIFPCVEKLLEKYDKGQILRYDKINLELNVKDWGNPEVIVFALEKQLSEKLKNTGDLTSEGAAVNYPPKQIEEENKLESTFLFFLEHGYLPWYGKEEFIHQISLPEAWSIYLQKATFGQALSQRLRSDHSSLNRFIYQLSSQPVISFIAALGIFNSAGEELLNSHIHKLSRRHKTLLLRYLLKAALFTEKESWIQDFYQLYRFRAQTKKGSKNTVALDIADIKDLLDETLNPEAKERIFLKPEREFLKTKGFDAYPKARSKISADYTSLEIVDTKNEDAPFLGRHEDEIYVRNAGLILIHPFIKAFFKNTKFLDSTGNIKSDCLFQAVQALHYLATGIDEYFEANLLLEKYLCGVSLKTPIPRESLIDGKIKTEGEVLLNEVIKNWPALKNTKPDGLRQMFIHRDGKLIKTKDGYKLIVERKAQDVLLDKLPWGISLVKLPWKDELLFVEW
ncbi:hypothetical protein SAMN06265379_1044 [Saccharicrinis carchari]|uniref:Uncharacterized protein n=1 Tax=Saccharicrinis carchari TaxID=1168039 RepID=A0A521CX39_SACCC|nr:contractile injection system tape measure protein [Saccharicrinis carchari]SMO63988.1 hypothetical protein SAMN06265379_1044 [Saccharicrinis carchari]